MTTRAEWQHLADDRILDAQSLFAAGRWAGAFYLIGYAVECGLKACVLARVGAHPEVIYEDRKFSNDAWTHDIERLVVMANVKTARDADAAANAGLYQSWQWVKDWSEESRYEQNGQPEAQRLIEAVIDPNNGAMQWIPSPLVMDEIDAGAEFLKRLNAYRPVKAACWLRKSEDEERYLYAALEGLTHQNHDTAYNEVLRITSEMNGQYVDPFRVKVISPDHRVAKAILDIYQRYPGRSPSRYSGRVFAGMPAAEVYIYPEFHGKP